MTKHPIRDASYALDPRLELMAHHATDSAVRCRECGKWFWTVVDDGKFGYVDEWEIDADLARAAFVDHDASALARLFVSNDLPKGPVWTSPSALIEIFRALTPNLTDAARVTAIESAMPRGLWAAAARALAAHASIIAKPPPLAFSIDLPMNRTFTDWFEVGEALVLFTGEPELLRLEARGLVQLPLSSAPSVLARHDNRALLAVTNGHVVLDAAGNAIAWPRDAGECSAMAIDDGHWLVIPQDGAEERWIEFHLPDGQPRAKLRRRFTRGARYMPAPQRFGGGWIVSNALDDDGVTVALTLFDEKFTTIAQSADMIGERGVLPIDDASFWAMTNESVERWERRDARLERIVTFSARSSYTLGRLLVIDTLDELVALAPNGSVAWRYARERDGATYLVETHMGLLAYGDSHAVIVSRAGKTKRMFEVDAPLVLQGRNGTVYMKSLAELYVIGEKVEVIEVGLDASLETISGDDAIVRRDDGTALLVGREGVRGAFDATNVVFSVIGSRGVWIVSGDRIRATPPPMPDARALADRIVSRLAIERFTASVRPLPSSDRFSGFAVVLPDGRAPVLVRNHAVTCGISIEKTKSWNVSIADAIEDMITEVVRETRAWAAGKHDETLAGKALRACVLLDNAFHERWTVSTPGTPDPTEMWLHGEEWDAASVGLFVDRPLDERHMLKNVATQHEAYARNIELSSRIESVARELAARIEGRFATRCVLRPSLARSHWQPRQIDIAFASATSDRIARVDGEDGKLRIHAGAPGRAGWDGGDPVAHFDDLARAIERMKSTLTLDRLKEGRKYRVLETIQGLAAGAIVRFDHYDDIDNHYGQYLFTSETGATVAVSGDFSTLERSPLGETYRYLEELSE